MAKGFYKQIGRRRFGAAAIDGAAGVLTTNTRRNPTVHQFTVGHGRSEIGTQHVPFTGPRGGQHTAHMHGVHIGTNVAGVVGAGAAAYGGYRLYKHFHAAHQAHVQQGGFKGKYPLPKRYSPSRYPNG